MKNTTLCYIERDGHYLMLHRTKKKNDVNHDKWLGIGGHFEEGESPEECALREIWEETEIRPESLCFRGIVTFYAPPYPTEYMYLFTATTQEEISCICDEGELAWVPIGRVTALPIWEGDRIFLSLLQKGEPFFSLKLVYAGDFLEKAILNGKELSL